MKEHSLKSEIIRDLASLYEKEHPGRQLHKDVQLCVTSWPIFFEIKEEKSNETDD